MEVGTRFTINGAAKRVTLNGRSFLVAPMTILVPGVLNGSQGALYYPDDEVAKDVGSWNHVPITVNHPTDPTTNANVSAAEDGVIERQGVGFLVNDHLDLKSGARKVDGYFDEQKTRAVDARIVDNLVAGRKVEVSTGLFTDNTQQSGEYRGKAYTHVARNYRPDHLAILPDQRGACSLEDGCGVNNAESPTTKSAFAMLANCGGAGGTPGPCETAGGAQAIAIKQPTPKARVDAKKAAAIAEEQRKRKAIAERAKRMDDAKTPIPKQRIAKTGTRNTENTMSKKVIAQLVANCDCLKGHEAALEDIPTDNLQKLLKKIAVVNAVKADGALVTNAEGSFRVTAEDDVELVDNEDEESDDSDDEDEPTDNCDDMDADDEEEKPMPPKKKKAPPIKNSDEIANKRPTLAEMLTNASPEEKDAWNRAVRINREERNRLIDRLTANARDDKAKKTMAETYNKLRTEELEKLVASMKPTRNAQHQQPVYVGPGGYNAPVDNADSDDVLDIPSSFNSNDDEAA